MAGSSTKGIRKRKPNTLMMARVPRKRLKANEAG
jgi:hypothetical protein